jgi:hypothetical protein
VKHREKGNLHDKLKNLSSLPVLFLWGKMGGEKFVVQCFCMSDRSETETDAEWQTFINSGLFDKVPEKEPQVGGMLMTKRNDRPHGVLGIDGDKIRLVDKTPDGKEVEVSVERKDVRPIEGVANAFLQFRGRKDVSISTRPGSEGSIKLKFNRKSDLN